VRHLRELEFAVHAAPDEEISLTDPDARAIATSGNRIRGWLATTLRQRLMRSTT
jgi:hypothetical protein